MTSVVIVAIPKQDDLTWRYSSEKVPHMTLLFLGENLDEAKYSHIAEYIEHAADTMLDPFHMSVESRGKLGDDDADVLFFNKGWPKSIWLFRNALLRNADILAAYQSAEQYPEWTPHLTMGYPETPAKPDNREYPGIGSVQFDRIALWTEDYDGPTVQLVDDPFDLELSMSDKVENVLSHFGIKGMKWGIRRSDAELARANSGGKSPDAIRASETLAKIRSAKSLTAVSNDDLNHLNNRLSLEKKFAEINPEGLDKANKNIKKVLKYGGTMNDAITFYNSPAGKLIRDMISPSKPYGKHAKIK